MTRIKLGIIGQGRSGRDIHAMTAAKLPELFDIVAVTDPLEERRDRAIREFQCEAYADYRELFARQDIDLIVNSTPSHLHVPVTLECLNHGFNVLCEKPLARWVKDVDALIETSRKTGKMLSVFQQLRFAPAFEKIRSIINAGTIGRVVQVNLVFNGFSRRWDWQTLQEKNGGNLLNTGPHPVDLALQLFGTDVMPQVVCIMDRANSWGDAEDHVRILLYGHGRPTVDLEISSCDSYPGPIFQVRGTRGGIQGSHQRLDWRYFKDEEAPDHELITGALSSGDGSPAYCSEELIWHQESWVPPSEREANPYYSSAVEFYQMLYRTLANGEPLEVTPEEVRQQIAVMEECFRQNPEFSGKHRF